MKFPVRDDEIYTLGVNEIYTLGVNISIDIS